MAIQRARPRRTRHRFDVQQAQLEFFAWRGEPSVMAQSHVHTDVEVNYVESGAITYFAGGQMHTVHPGEVAVFWAGMPHELTLVEAGTVMVWVVVPLAWFIQWRFPLKFEQALLRGDFLHRRDEDSEQHDAFMFRRWAEEMEHAPREAIPHIRRTAMLEVEARLRRFFRSIEKAAGQSEASPSHEPAMNEAGASQIEKMARFMSVHYRDELDVQAIAATVGLHPNYAMQLFKEQSGISLWEYLTRLRLSHAQRLLLTTDAKIERVAYESGFGSMARFYAAFKKYCQTTPRKWRLAYETKIEDG
jgi:AraC-like DNA-binding protein/quercetin dioxygenase-like cupin family protein